MNKSTRILLIVIGVLSILAGIYSFIKDDDFYDSLISVFVGLSLFGSVLLEKRG